MHDTAAPQPALRALPAGQSIAAGARESEVWVRGLDGMVRCRDLYAPGAGRGRARLAWQKRGNDGGRVVWLLEGGRGLCALRLQVMGGLEG